MTEVGQLLIGHQLRAELEALVGLRVERRSQPESLRLTMSLHGMSVGHLEALRATNQVGVIEAIKGATDAFLYAQLELGAGLHIGLFSDPLSEEEAERYWPTEGPVTILTAREVGEVAS